MKAFVCMFTVFVSACSLAAEVHALPEAVFADTEVSTNFAFAVGAAANRRLVFTLELQATPSNNVEVAIGCDADGDGALSLAQSALAVGYDCGEWFVRSAEKDAFCIVRSFGRAGARPSRFYTAILPTHALHFYTAIPPFPKVGIFQCIVHFLALTVRRTFWYDTA